MSAAACAAVYRPRRPRDLSLYRLVERCYEQVKGPDFPLRGFVRCEVCEAYLYERLMDRSTYERQLKRLEAQLA